MAKPKHVFFEVKVSTAFIAQDELKDWARYTAQEIRDHLREVGIDRRATAKVVGSR